MTNELTVTTPGQLPAVGYHESPGLSNSGMSDLAVSPLRYWHLWINPDRPADEPTPFMEFGSALHCAILEPDEFLNRYACKPSIEDYPGCLRTIEDIRAWLTERGIKPKGTRKDDVINQALAVNPEVPILDHIMLRHAAEHAGKVMFDKEDWARIYGASEALLREPVMRALLAEPSGRAEVKMTATDPESGVLMRSKMDWVTDGATVDIKTFTQKRGKSIDRSVADATYYEDYLRQAVVYTRIRKLQPGMERKPDPPFIIAFVESEPPHEVRFRVLRATTGGEVNVYWHQTSVKVDALLWQYARCVKRFGLEPWRDDAPATPLVDEEIPQLAFERIA